MDRAGARGSRARGLQLRGSGVEAARGPALFARAVDAGPNGAPGGSGRRGPDQARVPLAGAAAGRQPGAVSSRRQPQTHPAAGRAVRRRRSSLRGRRARASRRPISPPHSVPNVLLRPARAGLDLSDDLLCRGPERARLPRSAARGVRTFRRADAADVPAGLGHACRFRRVAIPDEVRACRSKRSRPRTKRR